MIHQALSKLFENAAADCHNAKHQAGDGCGCKMECLTQKAPNQTTHNKGHQTPGTSSTAVKCALLPHTPASISVQLHTTSHLMHMHNAH
jgi:hypothetical protein